MLSARKGLLHAAESLALVAALSCLGFAVWAHLHPGAEVPFELLGVAAFAVLMLTFGVACYLSGEYVKTVRTGSGFWERSDGLNAQEFSALIRWAPLVHKAAGWLGLAVALATGFIVGSVEWNSSRPATSREVVGASLYLSCFFLWALPVLASAARMPGSYLQQFAANDA
jgi:hypothetical protein